MKTIWIMRHGDAPYINGERQISDSGHQDIRKMAHWFSQQLKQQDERLSTLLVSPILRAQQTADTFEATLKELTEASWQRQTEPLISPESNPDLTIPFVEQTTQGTTLLISHMPLVSNLWAAWLGGESQYFPTSAMGCLSVELESGTQQARKVIFCSPDDTDS
ncbi:SixA phosphatase family protein [Kangiella sediminilitoris]|uniref:Phosphohistidine phosphatase, SixA n=1 Tax=Kangiella sediminilitoris TaxID=1144748 RepID=A0A1B3B9S2_9GAMM|nr:histidine phosphatase family protein [Kangiella sediminilitoris]AOE49544.1 Phosphohistidine phosphatase, SixA [Kangiella sediminilitoris]